MIRNSSAIFTCLQDPAIDSLSEDPCWRKSRKELEIKEEKRSSERHIQHDESWERFDHISFDLLILSLFFMRSLFVRYFSNLIPPSYISPPISKPLHTDEFDNIQTDFHLVNHTFLRIPVLNLVDVLLLDVVIASAQDERS